MSLQIVLDEVKLTGYVLPCRDVVLANQDDVLESKYEEVEIEPEFLDMKEMDCVLSGGKRFKSSIPASKEVLLKVGNDEYRVEGRFPLHDPWWEVTCTIRQGQHKNFVKGFPSYRLRTDLGTEGQSLVLYFLTACGAQPDFVKVFKEWLPKDQHVEPVNVLDVLQDFEDSSPENKAVAEQLKSNVNNSVAGTQVRVARVYPQIMMFLPTLLPGKFLEIISNGKMKNTQDTTKETLEQQNNTELLADLEQLIKTDVWKYGFSYVMFKEFYLINCEAKVEAFELCNLAHKIPELELNALQFYKKLQEYYKMTGSTYIEERMLHQDPWIKLPIEAAMFLHEQGVLIKQRGKVALHNLFSYEKGIAECLSGLAIREPWKIHLEVLQRAAMERGKAKGEATHSKNSDASTSDWEQNVMEQGAGCEQIDEAQTGTSSKMRNGQTHCDSPQSYEVKEEDSDSNNSTFLDIKLDNVQLRAAEMMCANPVTVISGKGGCGKTTVVSLIFKAAMEQQAWNSESKENSPIEFLLTAPTGRAASLLTKRSGFTAYTLHQVLWSYMNAKKDANLPEWKFSKVRFLVVDEASLVSVQIFHAVLSMLTEHAQLQKLTILGDVNQLPSIEPGNTLYDLFEGFKKVRWAIEMQKSHRAESELIVKNAGLISEMGKKKRYSPLEFDATINVTGHSTVPPDKSFIFVQTDWENYESGLQEAIQFLLKKAPGLEDHRLSQFVVFKRETCEMINELCCKHYSHHTTKIYNNKFYFKKGDKVCCTKNGNISHKDDENKQEETSHDAAGDSYDIPAKQRIKEQKEAKIERMCNGEIFFIKNGDVTEKNMQDLTLDDENGRVVTCCYRELQRECKLQHAWARTIHSFQGSEAETIVYVLGPGENWQHVYTAVTRGQKRVYVVGREGDLKIAIEKKITPRNTRLHGRVQEIVALQGHEDSFTQSVFSQIHVETPVNHGPSQPTPVASKRPAQSDPFTTQSKLIKVSKYNGIKNI